MSRKRLGRVQRVVTIVPLALLSAAWTASVAGVGGPTAASLVAGPAAGAVPDGTGVPEDAIDEPASMSNPGSVEDVVDKRQQAGIVTAAATDEIPSAALAAYQRAESVINTADKSCRISWELIAAIGRIESNHGRRGGNVLDDDGVARPGIYGPALNGKKQTTAVPDTDGGQYDRDEKWDRAVGPMQFIPSTWSVVGLDADGDDRRNPQDIDDAALASAVYLCSGKDDLSTAAGERAAVRRYNNSPSYVNLVLKVTDIYVETDFAPAPSSSAAAGYIVPDAPTYDFGKNLGASAPSATIKKKSGGSGTTKKGSGTTAPSAAPSTPSGSGGASSGTKSGGSSSGGSTSGGTTSGGTKSGGTKTSEPKVDIPDTGNEVVDKANDATENLINGMLGAFEASVGKAKCWARYPLLILQRSDREKCLASYGG
ncbi:hypothetical protein E8D34_01845 [Nocardioides sp. GY 10113]|uniref:lytic transglycosylase domain-containing protein n=1 Tax=Nocardioides sp. GY 10113 TaxID=2569761 RepID=UPI0010A91F4B|nr:hypothetical protein [Nocardioides sp. GY 10113]TIC89256.1 hypothetical protein E8D34_01845 [Nocardioides sp. GY 10113]